MEKEKMEEVFYQTLKTMVRAMDANGVWKDRSDDELIEDLFIRVPEKQENEGESEPDYKPAEPLNPYAKMILQSVATSVEQSSGLFCNMIAETGCDGSMHGIIYSDKSILLNKKLWNQTSLYFESSDRLKKIGGKMVVAALKEAQNITGQKQTLEVN